MKIHTSFRLLLSMAGVLLALSQCAAMKPSHRNIPSTHTRHVIPPTSRSNDQKEGRCDLLADLIETGKELLGKPYGYRRNLPWRMDCSGFVCYVFSRYNITLPRSSREQSQYVQRIKQPKPGDLLFFKGRNRHSNRVGHVAMVIDVIDGDPVMMHSTNSRGIIIERLSRSSYFAPRYLHAGRVPELARLIADDDDMVIEPTLSPQAPPPTKMIQIDLDLNKLQISPISPDTRQAVN